jgi:hypothetical protein
MTRKLLVRLAAGVAGVVAAGADLTRYWISSASEVTESTAGALVAEPISRDQAVAAAQAELGTADANVRVFLGQAPLYPGQANRAVWIVLFMGGTSPLDGPSGAPEPAASFGETGVLIDATTGEFLRGFMQ